MTSLNEVRDPGERFDGGDGGGGCADEYRAYTIITKVEGRVWARSADEARDLAEDGQFEILGTLGHLEVAAHE